MDKKNFKKLPGAKFVLLNCKNEEIACGITNACGELEFDCLPFGHYFLKELEAPCGYNKSNECLEVIVCDNNKHRYVEFVNTSKKGSIKVIKFGC